jgi:hypothetical protein
MTFETRKYGPEETKKEPVPIVDGSTKGKELDNACFFKLITKSFKTAIATDGCFCRWGSKHLRDQLVNLLLDFKEGVSKPAIMKHQDTPTRVCISSYEDTASNGSGRGYPSWVCQI